MDLIASKLPPVRHGHPDFFTRFGSLAAAADEICLTVGYVSEKSLLFLKENLEGGSLPTMILTIGMHGFDHFTRAQYLLVKEIAELLHRSGKGAVEICTAFPFHGKLHIFRRAGQPKAALLGSSNLSGLETARRIFELDVEIKEEGLLGQLEALQDDIRSKAATDFLTWKPKKFKPSKLMAGVPSVIGAAEAEVSNVKSRSRREYRLPLKCTARSNLNVYHGKGRETTKTGLIRPRPWYEIEIIVSNSITAEPGYPCKKAFDVITDDAWRFRCKTSGDYAKNFRSEGGLSVLGTWIKGRMEEAGKLRIGEVITPSHLADYGRTYVSLWSTDDPELWFLSFEPDP